jgi:hypothetical protein
MGVIFIELTSFSQDLVAKLITQRARDRKEAARRGPPPPPPKSR